MPVLFILLLILAWPFIEIAGFVAVGQHIGIFGTIALTLLTSALGALLLRIQGLTVLRRLQGELRRGVVPAAALGHAALIAVAGLLLLLPGFVSDVIGLLLFLPPVRSLILWGLARNLRVTVISTGSRRTSRRVVDLDSEDWHVTDPAEPRRRSPPGTDARIIDGRPDSGRKTAD